MLELYQLTENELFTLLKDFHYPDLERVVDDKYSSYDCISDEYGFYVELKCRQSHYDELMIEKLKYDRLKNWADVMGMIPLYICSTPQGIWEFNLDVLDIKWEDRDDLPATTQFEDKARISKVVGYLPITQGRNLFPHYPELFSEDELLDSIMEDADNEYIFDE
jgi:hypothetical protein